MVGGFKIHFISDALIPSSINDGHPQVDRCSTSSKPSRDVHGIEECGVIWYVCDVVTVRKTFDFKTI